MGRHSLLLAVMLTAVGSQVAGAALPDKEFRLPGSATDPIVSCRGGTNFNLAYCVNTIVRQKDATPTQQWKITIATGTHALKDAIVLFDVKNLEITGEANKPAPELRASGLPTNRLQHQYFSVLVINAHNVSIRGLNLNGHNLLAQRGVAICSTTGRTSSTIDVSRNAFKDYALFNVIIGNSPEAVSLTQISSYVMGATHPLKQFVDFLRNVPTADRYCGGNLNGLTFTGNVVRMKSVGLYLVPPTQKNSAQEAVALPGPGEATIPPAWYAGSEAISQKYTGIVVDGNQFLNDEKNYDASKLNQYHSAIKVHWSYGTRITNNIIEATDLPKSFESGAAVNVGPGMHGALIQGNTIKLAPGLKFPWGIGLISSYLIHETYGYGDRKIFGALTGVTIKENHLSNAVIRFMDCCVQVENADVDTRPYCQQRDGLVKNRTNVERVTLLNNRMNGVAYMDYNLIWRQSAKEPAWVKYYQDRQATGTGGIYCRKYMGVSYYSRDGVPR